MKRAIIFSTIAIILIVGLALLIGYLTHYVGWYADEKWKYRRATHDSLESKQRQVFVKSLQFRIENYPYEWKNFQTYIERSFTYDKNSLDSTYLISGSHYPYMVVTTRPGNSFIQLEKVIGENKDSVNWGVFLPSPILNDTLVYKFLDSLNRSGTILIWDSTSHK